VPELIDKFIFAPLTEVPPGATFESEVVDVSGAQYLSVDLEVVAPDADSLDVERSILFGREVPVPGAEFRGFLALHTDTFGPTGQLLTFTPVHGRRLFVTVTNNGSGRVLINFATVYGIREVP